MEKAMLEDALKYAGLGWPVIPLQPNSKRPYESWEKSQKKCATKSQIKAWWKKWPDANIGIVTGRVGGIVVLDIDGEEGLKAVKGKHLPLTPVVETGKGAHYYFKHPGGVVKNFVGKEPGLDFRGDGGYVVAPPSIHPSGHKYEWNISPDETPPTDIPDWLSDLLEKEKSISSNDPGWELDLLGERIGEGKRNDTIARLAGLLISKGIEEEAVLAMMISHSQVKFDPPLPVDEIEKTVQSIVRTEKKKKAEKAAANGQHDEFEGVDDLEPDEFRKAVLEGLSDQLDVKIIRIVKYMTEPAEYEMYTPIRSLFLGPVNNLIKQDYLRSKLAELTGKFMNPIASKKWSSIAQRLLDVCEEIDVGDETESKRAIQTWLRGFLEQRPPEEGEGWKEAACNHYPFILAGNTYFSMVSFKKYLKSSLDEKITTRKLVTLLRSYGCYHHEKGFRLDGSIIKRNLWVIPDDLYSTFLEVENE